MRVLVAPDSFKGTLTASEAAAAIARGVRRAVPDADIDECPLADGGEGTLEVVARATSAGMRTIETPDLLGEPVHAGVARWTDADGTACTLIESAQVVGLPRVPPRMRNPVELSSGALGTLVGKLGLRGDDTLFIAIGGSATVDGGRWLRSERPSAVRPRRVIAVCDVDNPLLGEHGAARVFGPQKGATPDDVAQLEAGLENLVRVCEEAGMSVDPDAPGAGAAGGLGFGLAAFLGAELVRGSAWVCDAVGFDEQARMADLVITGEGRLDEQTRHAKVIDEVCRRAGALERPVVAAVGSAAGDGRDLGLADVEACVADGSAAPGDAPGALEDATARLSARFSIA